ncbi:MAG: hypothetical protein KKE51_03610 [Gammaproteobacteria bacterium]|nr:hypothetical protein [Gammaproteobacteria bacterium]MBU1602192.1 hypothetical protein [Gammaproteobacteria bacterium]MBU2434239.1 hypothetical protein [Gammaproteobacteria bacterium]
MLALLNDQSLVELPKHPTATQLRKELDRLRLLAVQQPGNVELNLNISRLRVRLSRHKDQKQHAHMVQGGIPGLKK